MPKTRIFISSTCYDLSQIRQDLKESLLAIGHEPIMSENKDFPVNPMASTQESCIEAVKQEADVFVLIIGNRYGYKVESGQSITNLEFLTAVQKGIPIYTFSLKSMIHVLPLWKKNPTSDFTEYVDDTKVFEFIEQVRSNKGLWNFEFETAQDIIEILKPQLSILLNGSLSDCLKLNTSLDKELQDHLSGKALELLLKKPESYETRLFLQMMADEIGKHAFEKNDCTYSIYIKRGESLEDIQSCLSWHSAKLNELHNSVDMLNNLFSAYSHYYGEPGVPSDIKGLYYVAVRYGELYSYLLKWVIDVRSADVCDECKAMKDAFAELPLKVISQIEEYPTKSLTIIDTTLQGLKNGKVLKGSEVNLHLQISLDEEVQKRYSFEMTKVAKSYNSRI